MKINRTLAKLTDVRFFVCRRVFMQSRSAVQIHWLRDSIQLRTYVLSYTAAVAF